MTVKFRAALAAALFIPFAAQATIYTTYAVNEHLMGGSATGTITVDAMGALSAANFTDWNITMQLDTGDSAILTSANSSVHFGGVALPGAEATQSTLTIYQGLRTRMACSQKAEELHKI